MTLFVLGCAAAFAVLFLLVITLQLLRIERSIIDAADASEKRISALYGEIKK